MELRTHIRHVETFLHGSFVPLHIVGRHHVSTVVARATVFIPIGAVGTFRVGKKLIVLASLCARGIALSHFGGRQFVDYAVGDAVLLVEIAHIRHVVDALVCHILRHLHQQERILVGADKFANGAFLLHILHIRHFGIGGLPCGELNSKAHNPCAQQQGDNGV